MELILNKDLCKTGHLFCCDCATELNVVLEYQTLYHNPNYHSDWDSEIHQFHNVRYVFPKLLKKIWDKDRKRQLECPDCGFVGKIIVMDRGLFDVKLILNSLNIDITWHCMICEGSFASRKHVSQIKNGYICGDCVAYA